MKYTNTKCTALNLYIPVCLCNLPPNQDTEHKARTRKELKDWSLTVLSENTDRHLGSHCYEESFWLAETFTYFVIYHHKTKCRVRTSIQDHFYFLF